MKMSMMYLSNCIQDLVNFFSQCDLVNDKRCSSGVYLEEVLTACSSGQHHYHFGSQNHHRAFDIRLQLDPSYVNPSTYMSGFANSILL
jgi:hypothetical protein